MNIKQRFGGGWLLAGLMFFGVSSACWCETPSTQPAAETSADADAPSPDDLAADAKLLVKIDFLRFDQVPLGQVLDDLAKKSQIQINVDWDALKRADVQKDAPVTARLRDIKASKALEIIFKSVEGEDDDHRLGYRISKGFICISTRAELHKLLITRTYDITDLLAGHPDQPPSQEVGMSGKPRRAGEVASQSERLDEIKKYLTDNVDTNTWKDNGGDVGEIETGSTSNLLVIKQTPENQRKIGQLLKSLRHPEPSSTSFPSLDAK